MSILTVRRVPWNYASILCLLICGVVFINVSTYNRRGYHENDGSPEHIIISTEHEQGVVRTWTQQLTYEATLPPISGYRNSDKKFLAIGISTIYRSQNYLKQTLKSFLQESTPGERENTVVIIYLADTNVTRKGLQLQLIEENFQSYLNSGFIQVIDSTPAIYPPMDFALTKRTFNDSVDRVTWRSKQVIDFTFLFSYAKNISEYYLVAEDDIITTRQYVTAIRDFVEAKKHVRWVALEFSEFMGIGLLFRNNDLPALVELLIMFYQYQPVDMLMRQFIALQIPDTSEKLKRDPSIFQHMGRKSTLANKIQKIVDTTFGLANRRFTNKNPAANLSTTMTVYNGLTPDYAYKQTPGYFWGIPQDINGTVDIVFTEPLNVSRIVIISGLLQRFAKTKVKDIISDGSLEMSVKRDFDLLNGKLVCVNFLEIGVFKNGIVDADASLVNVQCLRVKIGKSQRTWVIIREIEIFLNRNSSSSTSLETVKL